MLEEYVPTEESISWLLNVAHESFAEPYNYWNENGHCSDPLVGRILHEYELSHLIFMLSPPDGILKEMYPESMPCPMDHIERLSLSNYMLNHCDICLTCNTTQLVMHEIEENFDKLLNFQSKIDEQLDMGLSA